MNKAILQIKNLTHHFKTGNAFFKVLDNISFDIYKGEIFGLVGESGCGKSTLARCLMNIYTPTAGKIIYDGIETTNRNEYQKFKKRLQSERQIIFQDSMSALNQKMKIIDIVSEPMKIQKIRVSGNTYRSETVFQLGYVGIDETNLEKYPFELSGGQRQRVAIARALSMQPKLLIADEPVASLDVSIQAQIINLFSHLQREHGLSILFIAHNLALVQHLCNRIGVMYRGKLVELAPTDILFNNPIHPYTKELFSAFSKSYIGVEDSYSEINDVSGEIKEIERGHFVLI